MACSVIEGFFDTQNTFVGHFEHKTQATANSLCGNKLATFFAFKSQKLEIRGRQAQMDVLTKVFENTGWVVLQLVECTRHADDFFFDAVAQIQMDSWYKDRVALVGGACQCLILLAGQGASMGMVG